MKRSTIDQKNPARLFSASCVGTLLGLSPHAARSSRPYLPLALFNMISHKSKNASKVIVPAHIPKPLPDHLRSALVSALLASSSIENIQSAMHDKCTETGWLDAIHQRAKDVIHNDEADTWGEVMAIITKEVLGNEERGVGNDAGFNGKRFQNARRQPEGRVTHSNIIVRMPDEVVKSGVSAVRAALDNFIELERA